MSYIYAEQRDKLFTDDGQRMFLQFRDNVNRLIATAGAVRMDQAMTGLKGEVWMMLACADRMLELGEMIEVSLPNSAGQHRIFTRFMAP